MMPNLPKRQKTRSYTVRPRTKAEYGNNSYNFYNSQTWRDYSRRYRVNYPMCEVCKREPAKVVDHVIRIVADDRGFPIETGGAAWDEQNHMAMCHGCHNRKRGKEGRGFEAAKVKGIGGYVPKNREDIIKALT